MNSYKAAGYHGGEISDALLMLKLAIMELPFFYTIHQMLFKISISKRVGYTELKFIKMIYYFVISLFLKAQNYTLTQYLKEDYVHILAYIKLFCDKFASYHSN